MDSVDQVMVLVDLLADIPPWHPKSVKEKAKKEIRDLLEKILEEKCLGCNIPQLPKHEDS